MRKPRHLIDFPMIAEHRMILTDFSKTTPVRHRIRSPHGREETPRTCYTYGRTAQSKTSGTGTMETIRKRLNKDRQRSMRHQLEKARPA